MTLRLDTSATELVELDALELSGKVARREISCVEVMRAFLAQIDRLNPRINAIIGLRPEPELLAEAEAADARLARGEHDGWLHGLPVAVKELAEVRGLPWTSGSPLFRDRVGATDELFVRRMRAAGAIIIGKTNVPEFGYGSQSYNPVWGVTRNPYDPARTVGGSSGGAAAALAARMLPVADGSDYLGSLRNPAAFCNVVGFRPSAGRLPKPGFVAQLGEIGPMGRSVADVAALLSVMAGPDPSAPLALREDPQVFAGPLEREVAGTRIAWVGDLGGHLATDPGVLELGRSAAAAFEAMGCVVEEALPEFSFAELWDTLQVWRGWGAMKLLPLYSDPALRAQMKPEAQWEVEQGLTITADDLFRAEESRVRWFEAVRAFFSRYDVVLAPAAQVFPFPVETHWPAEVGGRPMDTYHRWMETVAPWSMAGSPVIGLPAGFDERGLPNGVQLAGPHGGDLGVLQLAHAYEQSTQWVRRVRPAMLALGAS